MKQYPEIAYWNKGTFGDTVFAFDKLDGSNIRAEYSKKLSKKTSYTNGFGKFGTRKTMIARDDANWGRALEIFMNKYSEKLDRVFCENKYYRNCKEMTVFLEYFGDLSFAGWHNPNDPTMDIVLIEVDQYKRGIITPKEFLDNFGHLHLPKVVYHGNYNMSFIEDVRNNVFNLKEGVVCKGVRKTKGQDIVYMVKIKTQSWLDKLKNKYGQDKLLEELNGDITLL